METTTTNNSTSPTNIQRLKLLVANPPDGWEGMTPSERRDIGMQHITVNAKAFGATISKHKDLKDAFGVSTRARKELNQRKLEDLEKMALDLEAQLEAIGDAITEKLERLSRLQRFSKKTQVLA